MKTKFRFFRYDKEDGKLKPYSRPYKAADGTTVHPGFYPEEHGGVTQCFVEFKGKVYSGEAHCSKKDSFSYAIGRKISWGRALALLEGGKVKFIPQKSILRDLRAVAIDRVRQRRRAGGR